MKLDFSKPGVAISALAHGAVLALLILHLPWLSDNLPPDEMPEAVPIETISTTDFNQIMKGEKSSTETPKEPTTKVDKVAEAEEQHKEPPKPEVQKEVPPPPPPKPAEPPVPTPPLPPTPPPPPPPVPEPPQRPDPTPPPPLPPVVPTPPLAPKPAPPAPVPPERDPEAEVIKPAPPPPPKPVPKPPEPPKRAEVKPPPPKPVPKPPEPPKVVEAKPPPKPHPAEKPQPDPMAKLVEQAEADPTPAPPRPAHKPAHPKPTPAPQRTAAAEGTAEPSEQRFDPTDISKILNAEPSGAPPSTGRQVSKAASRGAASGSAPKMSVTQSDALDGLLADQFKQCWSYLGLDHGHYIPEIKVNYSEDGSLVSEPTLLNRPSDPAARSLAESALRAVRQCNPLKIPAQFSPYYDQWRSRILRFDPAEMAG